jgi:hypothetical protein
MKFRLSLLSLVLTGAAVVPSSTASALPSALPKCPTAKFLDLSKSKGAGAGYAKPSSKVTCTTSEVVVTTNNMISFPFINKTPHTLAPQNLVVKFPRDPKVATAPTKIVNQLGTMGITVSGLLFYGATEGPVPTESAWGDPYYNKMLDTCGGHAGPQNEYHYHVLLTIALCNLKNTGIIAYAIDGFPVYGPTGCLDVKCTKKALMTSGYLQTGDPQKNVWNAYSFKASTSKTVLDECNGRIQPDGTYGYHATLTFPYIVGCLKGTPKTQSGAAAAPMPAMGGNNQQPPPGGNDQKPPPPPGGNGKPPPGGSGKPPPGGSGAPPSTVKSNSVESLSVNNFASFYCNLL